VVELQVEMLGGLRVRQPGGAEIRMASRKAQAVLACLALQPGVGVSRDFLSSLLWEDSDPELARASLRQALAALRRALPEKVGRGLQGDGQNVLIDAALVTSDVARFRALLKDGSADALSDIASVVGGVLLDGFDARSASFAQWLDERRRELRRDQQHALERCAAAARSLNRTEREVEALERLTALEPTNEGAHRELIDAYTRLGRHTDALRQFRACRDALRRELDIAPEPATEALYREVMKRRRVARSAADAGSLEADDDAGAIELRAAAPRPEESRTDETLREVVVVAARQVLDDEADPETVRARWVELEARLREIVGRLGGAVDFSVDGDALAVFGLRTATGHELGRAAAAALELRTYAATAGLALSIGLAQGQVLPSGRERVFPISGTPVRAARDLARHAATAEIAAPAALRAELEREFDLQAVVDTPADDPVVRIRRALDAPAAPRAFAGRRAELAMLQTLFERVVAARRGRTVVVRGDAGIGKSALLAALSLECSAQDAAIHVVRVLDFGQPTRERPIPSLAARLLGIAADSNDLERGAVVERSVRDGVLAPADASLAYELLGVDPPRGVQGATPLDNAARERGRTRVLHELLAGLARSQPQLVIVEDLHWADAVEVAQFADLAAAAATQPVLLALTTRADGDPVSAAWRARARGCPVTTLDLAPLADDEARELAAAYRDLEAAVVDRCIETAAGNPLFLEQLLRAAQHGQTEVPGSVRALLLARVERLEPAARHALHAAAVLGSRFSLGALRHVLADPTFEVSELRSAGLIGGDAEECHFSHALIRDAVYGSLLRSLKRDWHARAALWFEHLDHGLEADHLAAAGDPGAARAYLRAAAQQQRAHRLEGALNHALRARETAVHAVDLFESCAVLGDVYLAKGRTDDAIAAYRESIDLAATGAARARAWLGLAASLRICDRYDEALAALNHAERGAALDADPRVLAQLWTLRGNLHFPRGELDECLAAHREARRYAEESGSPDDLARSLGGLGDAHYQRGRMRTARAQFSECVALCEQNGLAGLRLAYLPMLAVTAAYMGEFNLALAVAGESASLAKAIGDPRAELLGLSIRGNVELMRGEPASALEACARSTQLAHEMGAKRFEAEGMVLQALALRQFGRRDEAHALAARGADLAREVCPTYCGPWAYAALALLTEDSAACRALLDEGEHVLRRGCVSHNHLDFRPIAIDVCLRHGDLAAALRHADELERYTLAEPLPPSSFYVLRARLLVETRAPSRDASLTSRLTAALESAEDLQLRAAAVDLKRALTMAQGTVT
jgi:DNA-binding SARP family transcriptional activator